MHYTSHCIDLLLVIVLNQPNDAVMMALMGKPRLSRVK